VALAALEHLKGSQHQHDDHQSVLGHWQLLAASGVIALSLPIGQALCEASRVCSIDATLQLYKGLSLYLDSLSEQDLHRLSCWLHHTRDFKRNSFHEGKHHNQCMMLFRCTGYTDGAVQGTDCKRVGHS